MPRTLVQVIKDVELRRSLAANEAIIFETNTGKALARGRAYAFNAVLKMLYEMDGAPPRPERVDEYKEGGTY